jgi:hypothetical protein
LEDVYETSPNGLLNTMSVAGYASML